MVYSMELNQAEERLVYASLSGLLVDYIARIKCNGHAGTASEENFCLYCKAHLRHLTIPKGYQREGKLFLRISLYGPYSLGKF
jgi:hypothetical protein